MFVEIPQDGHVQFLGLIQQRKEWDFHQTGLDGFDESKVADNPRIETVGFVAGSGQIIRRGTEIVDPPELEFLGNAAQAGEPDGGPFVFFLRVLAFGFPVILLRQVAVMGLIVHHEQTGTGPEVSHEPADHLGEILSGFGLAAIRTDFSVEGRFLVP